MQWPDNSAPGPEQATRPEPSWTCCACGGRGRWHKCARCRTVRYCSAECQAAHWPAHRLHCRNLPAGSAGGASSTASARLLHAEAPAPPGEGSLANGSGTAALPGTVLVAAPCTRHERLGATVDGPSTGSPTAACTPGPSLTEVELAELPRLASATPQHEALHAAEVEEEPQEHPCEEAGFATIPPWEYAQSPHGEDNEETPDAWGHLLGTVERLAPAIPRGLLLRAVAEPPVTPRGGCHVDLPGGSL